MPAETSVRMGRLAASATAGDVLVTIGLGSCIGLVVADRRSGAAGLAHVMLPAAAGHRVDASTHGKFADLAVPALVGELQRLGARPVGLQAALVGGAHMFSFAERQLDVGARNEAAVREGLAAARIPVRAAATGGGKGRTVKVHLDGMRVVVKEAAGAEQTLLELR